MWFFHSGIYNVNILLLFPSRLSIYDVITLKYTKAYVYIYLSIYYISMYYIYLYAVLLLNQVHFVPHIASQEMWRFAAKRVYSQGSQGRQGGSGLFTG